MIIFKRLLRFYLWQIPNDGQISRGGIEIIRHCEGDLSPEAIRKIFYRKQSFNESKLQCEIY